MEHDAADEDFSAVRLLDDDEDDRAPPDGGRATADILLD
jgi:hypothetical protein